jgi:DNA-binding response OmpR family regulator
MKSIWIVDDDEEMSRAISLFLGLMDCETTSFLNARRSKWRSLPVLMLSSEATDVMIDRALEIGADGYMTKPITYEELETAISRAFQKNQKGFTTHA